MVDKYKSMFPGSGEKIETGTDGKNSTNSVVETKNNEQSKYQNMFPTEDQGWYPTSASPNNPFIESFTDPRNLAASAALGLGTAGAQKVTLPRNVRKEAHQLRREAAEYVKSGRVPPSGLTGVQKYAAGVQDAIAPQNIDPIHSTPSLIQQNVVHPQTAGTQRVLEIEPGARTVPGSEMGLVHTGSPSSVRELETNPLTKTNPMNAQAVSQGTATSERLAKLTENLSPSQREMLTGLLEKGYALPDVMGFLGKVINKTAVPLAVASIPEQIHAANEYYKAGDYQHMLTSGLGAAGGAALGAGAGLAALAAAPEIATGLGVAGTIGGLAPVGQAIYDWYKDGQ